MNTIRISRVFFVLAALVTFSAVSSIRAEDQALGTAVGTVTVPAGFNKDDVQDIIAMTLTGRGWTVQDKTADKVVGYLKHRTHEATVTFVYNDKQVSLYCVSYEINKKTGAHIKPDLPKGWLNNLRSDLTKRLNRNTAK